jgi:hypothetical protein
MIVLDGPNGSPPSASTMTAARESRMHGCCRSLMAQMSFLSVVYVEIVEVDFGTVGEV